MKLFLIFLNPLTPVPAVTGHDELEEKLVNLEGFSALLREIA